jgi:hypothetical protein
MVLNHQPKTLVTLLPSHLTRKPQAQGVRWRHAEESSSLRGKKLCKFIPMFSAEELGMERGWECGPGLRIDLGKGLWLLLGKELYKERSLLLAM